MKAIIIFLFAAVSAYGQPYTENIPIPHLLNRSTIDGFTSLPNHSVFLYGIAHSARTDDFESWDTLIPYFTIMSPDGNFISHFLPDTGYFGSYLYLSYGDQFDVRSVWSGVSPTFFYSKQDREYDCTPVGSYYSIPITHAIRFSPSTGRFDTLFTESNALNPCLAGNPGQSLHFIWSRITALPNSWGSFNENYRGAIYYRFELPDGSLSVPQFVDSGYSPILRVDGTDGVHLLWFSADSSVSPVFAIKYAHGHNGVFTAPRILGCYEGDLPDMPQQNFAPTVSFSVNNAGTIVHVAWEHEYDLYSLRIIDGQLSLDSLHESFFNLNCYVFRPNDGAVFAFLNGSSDRQALRYSSTINGPLFGFMKTLQLPFDPYDAHYFLNPSSGHPNLVSVRNGTWYLEDLVEQPDSSRIDIPANTTSINGIKTGEDGEVFAVIGDIDHILVHFLSPLDPLPRRDVTPTTFRLEQNYPNPFNPSTMVMYNLPVDADVRCVVYNTLGQNVATLVSGIQPAGPMNVRWNASGVPSGLYLCRLDAVSIADPTKHFSLTRKMMLVK